MQDSGVSLGGVGYEARAGHAGSQKQRRWRPFQQDRVAPQTSMLGRRDIPGHSFEEDLRHHPLVFVIEKMAVKDGHAFNDGISEIHNDVDGTAVGDIHGI